MKKISKALAFLLLLAMMTGHAAAVSQVTLVTAKQLKYEEEHFAADVQIPGIRGLGYSGLEIGLNAKYLSEGRRFFREFKHVMRDMGEGNLGAYSGYFIQTQTDSLLSVGRYFLWIQASGAEKNKFDTIDLEKKILLTLPCLFKDGSYVEIISDNIREQMREQMAADEGVIYWVDEFEGICGNQEFYITDDKLVISFDEYAVAPGVMGVVEFTIPTELIADILCSDEYIK